MRFVLASTHAVSWSLLAHVVTAHAAHPFITDDTRTQGGGNYELQLGAQYTRAPFDDVVISNFQFAPQLTYGVVPDVDAILRPTYNVNVLTGVLGGRSAGFGDTSVEFKWRFWSAEAFSVGMRAGTGFASGNLDRGLDSGQSTPRAYLLFTAVLPAIEFDVNVGTARNVNDPAARQWLGHVSVLALWRVRDLPSDECWMYRGRSQKWLERCREVDDDIDLNLNAGLSASESQRAAPIFVAH